MHTSEYQFFLTHKEVPNHPYLFNKILQALQTWDIFYKDHQVNIDIILNDVTKQIEWIHNIFLMITGNNLVDNNSNIIQESRSKHIASKKRNIWSDWIQKDEKSYYVSFSLEDVSQPDHDTNPNSNPQASDKPLSWPDTLPA